MRATAERAGYVSMSTYREYRNQLSTNSHRSLGSAKKRSSIIHPRDHNRQHVTPILDGKIQVAHKLLGGCCQKAGNAVVGFLLRHLPRRWNTRWKVIFKHSSRMCPHTIEKKLIHPQSDRWSRIIVLHRTICWNPPVTLISCRRSILWIVHRSYLCSLNLLWQKLVFCHLSLRKSDRSSSHSGYASPIG